MNGLGDNIEDEVRGEARGKVRYSFKGKNLSSITRSDFIGFLKGKKAIQRVCLGGR